MRPLLRGQLARDAHARIAALSARTLRRRSLETSDVSLAGGLAGLALVHASLADRFPASDHGVRAQDALDRTMERIGREPLGPGLYAGLAGVGWVLEELAMGEAGDDPCSVVDGALVEYVERHPQNDPFDLVNGLVGIGVYGLERLPRRSGKRLLGAVVSRLKEVEMRGDLGVAHGVAGVIALLGRIIDADIGARIERAAHTLLEETVEWLLAQELPRGAGGCFAAAVGSGQPRRPARLAWCYGDLGIAAAMLVAARAAREPTWERAAERIGLRAAARSEASSGVRDAGLCHGAAGVAHVFHRLYRSTGETRFAAASRRWFMRALTMPARGPGFLMGAGGITLALLAATGDNDPAWNRVLLLP